MGAIVASCIFVIVGQCSKVEEAEDEGEGRRRSASSKATSSTDLDDGVDSPPSYEDVIRADKHRKKI